MAFEKVVLLYSSVVARDFENRLWDRNLQFLEDLSDTLVHFVPSKESILAGFELDGLKLSKVLRMTDHVFPQANSAVLWIRSARA